MLELQPSAAADRSGSQSPDLPEPPSAQPGLSDFVRLGTLAIITAALVALCLLLIVPFLPGVTWGIALAIIADPIDRAIARRVGNRTVSAVVSTLLVTALILVPGLFVAYRLALETATAAEKLQAATADAGHFANLRDLPGMSQVVPWLDRFGVDLEAQVRSFIGAHTQDVAQLTQGSAAAVVQFLLTIFILYYLFRDRERFLAGLRELLPLSHAETEQVLAGAAGSVHANLRANLITSAIDSTAGGLVFWAVGLPAPLLWSAVMFILALLPILGAGLVWVPAALFLIATGKWLGAAAILTTGTICFIFVDNLLFSRLAGDRMRMHPVLTLVAFLGGIALFGTSGMVLGPAVFAVTLAVIEVWRRRLRRNEVSGGVDHGRLVIVSGDD